MMKVLTTGDSKSLQVERRRFWGICFIPENFVLVYSELGVPSLFGVPVNEDIIHSR